MARLEDLAVQLTWDFGRLQHLADLGDDDASPQTVAADLEEVCVHADGARLQRQRVLRSSIAHFLKSCFLC